MRKLLLLILVFSWTLTPGQAQQKKQLTFSHIFDDTFAAESIKSVDWMRDGRFYTAVARTPEDIELRKYDITTGEYEVLTATSNLQVEGRETPIFIQGYEFSDDETRLLIKTDVESIWRRSTRERYFVYDRDADSTYALTTSLAKQQHGALAPAGDKAAFVEGNNLYWVDLSTGERIAITTDGEENAIINGATDWVYEEEFGFAKAWFWSPDGSKIAFYRFDESRVREFFYTEWGSLYPGQVQYKYPKAGEKNAIVTIGIYDLPSGETTWMDIGSESDQYIPRINWTTDSNQLAIRRMNRLQNTQDLMLANATTGETETILTEESDTWLDVNDDLTFLDNGEQFIYTSQQDGYNHIYLYDMSGNLIRQITEGTWDVTEFLGYDEDRRTFFYISAEASPLQRHLYSIGIDGDNKQQLSSGDGWASVDMSRDFSYYIQTYSTPEMPPHYTLHDGEGAQVRVLEDNAALADSLAAYTLPQKEFLTLDLAQATLNGYMMKPVDFDSTKKYGVLFYVYGGPGSQTVTRQFDAGSQRALWHSYLTSKGYIVVSIDGRGTGARGRDFEKQVYTKLGQYEIQDQKDAAQRLASQHSFMDENRMGIWGWSYGGYMAALGISKAHEVFSAAISVAPVTNWRYYDTIYTERYMQTPQMNAEGYRKGSPLTYAGDITGDYLLIHGTGDDNVHFQNSVAWVDELVKQNIPFDTMYYPNRNHGIYGGNTRRHLYQTMTNFIIDNL